VSFPAGPWVLVVGMHRSGTSAVAGALGGLGLALPDPHDRIDDPESNPEHFESLSVSRYDERLLEQMGGSWTAPPELALGWERDPRLLGSEEPAALMSSAYPEAGPLVWKDPRLCLLLPYWKVMLPPPLVAVLVWREPLAVASSLQLRDGLRIAEGLALWERYNRSALAALDGVDTYVLDYDDLLARTAEVVEGLAGWLAQAAPLAAASGSWSVESGARAVTAALRHHPPEGKAAVLLEHAELVEGLSKLAGGHRPLRISPLSPESTWTTSLLEARLDALRNTRRVHALESELSNTRGERDTARGEAAEARGELATAQGYLAGTRAELAQAAQALGNLRASTSWRLTGPLRAAASLGASLRRARRGGRP
jgi:hypothetical protein